MKAVNLSKRPSFSLMKQSDVVSFYHMQMPRWLFLHSKYKSLSLEAKVAYTFLLNRFQLSKLNGWVNDENEVFVIFTREALAEEMGVSYRKAIECFKELTSVNLVWERRPGRGQANQIYLASVILDEPDADKDSSAPFGCDNSRGAESAGQGNLSDGENTEPLRNQGVPITYIKECENCSSGTTITAHQDLQNSHTSNIDNSYTDISYIDTSQSGSLTLHEYASRKTRADCGVMQQTDGTELQKIINKCDMDFLSDDVRMVFKNAIERLYYAESFCVNGVTLPRGKIRSDLQLLDSSVIIESHNKLSKNTSKVVKNSTAYVMAVIYNTIFEVASDVMVDAEFNRMIGGQNYDFN